MQLYIKALNLLKYNLKEKLKDSLEFYAYRTDQILIADRMDKIQITMLIVSANDTHMVISFFYNGMYYPKRHKDRLSNCFAKMICKKLNKLDVK